MPPSNPTLMPNKFLELNCTSPNNIIPKPVVMMSFIWPAFCDTSDTMTDATEENGHDGIKASSSVPVIVVAKGELMVVHLNMQRFNRNAWEAEMPKNICRQHMVMHLNIQRFKRNAWEAEMPKNKGSQHIVTRQAVHGTWSTFSKQSCERLHSQLTRNQMLRNWGYCCTV